jgi:TPR repeat protein
MVGNCYASKRGVERDYIQAVAWYRKAAEQGHAEAQYNLGICFENGTGVPWANREDSISEWRSIKLRFEERNGPKKHGARTNVDEIEAYAYFQIASTTHERARNKLKELEASMSAIRLEKAKKRASELGAKIASNQFAIEEAMRHLKAATLGDSNAQFNIGLCYHEGRGVTKDFVQAVSWYQKSAAQGNAAAQNKLGDWHEQGEGVDRDIDQAMHWWQMSANQGYAPAQKTLGDFYSGELFFWTLKKTSKDMVKALSWYRKAAGQDHPVAQHRLGGFYHNGKGVNKDLVQAISWYRKAAEQGNTAAQRDLGLCYANGEGVIKDVIEAYAYLNLKTDDADRIYNTRGYWTIDRTFVEFLNKFYKSLTPEEIAAGKKRASELQKEIEAKIAAKKAGK